MRNSYKFFNALFLGYTLVLGACSKEEEITPIVVETPEGIPTIQITEPFGNATVNGTIAIKVAVKPASANSTLEKVVVSIDDVVLKESKESAITLDWDSKTVTNGAHVIKVVATTVSGKKAETSIGIKVDNVDVLVDFDLPFDYLFWNGTEVWFFASDENGALIDVIKVKLNAHNILARKNGFKGDTFTLTGVYKSSFGVTFCTLADFKAGAYTLPSWDDLPSRSSIGEAAITFTDHVGGVNTYHYASGSSSMNIENVSGGQIHKGSLYTNPASYLYSHRVADGIEYMTGDIAPGDNLTRSVSAMKLMDKQEVTFAKGLTGEIYANGNRDDGYYSAYYSEPVTALPDTRKKTMYYPGSFFNSYNIQLRAESADGGLAYNHYLTNTKTLPTEMSYLDCSTDGYAITGNTYKVSIQGTCDYVYSRSYQSIGADKFVNWRVWTAPNAELVIPAIPDVIRNTYSDLREFSDLSVRAEIIMADYAEVNGYNDYVKAPRGFMDFVVDSGWANWRSTTWNAR